MKKLLSLVIVLVVTLSLMGVGTAETAAPLKVALCMSGAVNDQGWNQTAYEGALKACEKYGFELSYTENLGTADIAAAFADYAASGYDVVIGHGYEFGDPALEVAETYPNVTFICTEADASADNVASYVMACEQTAYVEGIIAANMTKTGKVGGIGPIQGDSLVKIINGFEDGAHSVNPDLVVETAWTNSFVDTQLAKEAATAMIEDGVDVIKHCANACGNGAISAAVDAGIWCQGDSYDQSSLAPDNILDSALYNLDVVLDIALGSVADGTFKGDVYNLGMADNAVAVLLSDNLPEDVAAIAQEAIDSIISGDLVVVRDYAVRN
ncbi:MAG: BMP family protein [Eubacteriales bacterium]|nr:BMP family protein [Eubacteriales bacterium]